MEELLSQLFSEYGIMATLFVLIVGGMIVLFIRMAKYFPTIVDRHFVTIETLAAKNNRAQEASQENFSRSLSLIANENKVVTAGLLRQFEKQGDDHKELLVSLNESIRVLTKIDRTQDVIHNVIKDCKK